MLEHQTVSEWNRQIRYKEIRFIVKRAVCNMSQKAKAVKELHNVQRRQDRTDKV